ncbi:MAG: hypothetical protein IPJ79_08135 [Bacteroidetes bacterium]|nr:hypothetical protein [Bacteroidota bacterium]
MPISKNNIMLNPYPLLIAIIFLAVTHPLCAQTPNWKWAKEASGNESDIPQAIATDVNGNVIVAGYFASDSLVVGSTVLQNSAIGFQEAFIAKYDSSGNCNGLMVMEEPWMTRLLQWVLMPRAMFI